jgi:hypothetical protein
LHEFGSLAICEGIESGLIRKTKSLVRYLTEKSTKSLCQLQDSDDFCFLDLLDFWPFCANFSDNLVTIERFEPSRA